MENKLRIISGTLSKAHDTDAGYDIVATETTIILEGCSKAIKTDLVIQLPKGYVGLVSPRSGLSFKHNIETGAGVIDYGYTGEVKVKLYNFGKESYTVNKGDRIAQLVVLPIYQGELLQISHEDLEETSRGNKGFGSSDK